MGNGYYYEEQARMEYTRPPPRAYYASSGSRSDRMVVEVAGPSYHRSPSPSPTRVVVVHEKHKERPRRPYVEPEVGCWAVFCATFCCCCVCCAECLDDTCCPYRSYD